MASDLDASSQTSPCTPFVFDVSLSALYITFKRNGVKTAFYSQFYQQTMAGVNFWRQLPLLCPS